MSGPDVGALDQTSALKGPLAKLSEALRLAHELSELLGARHAVPELDGLVAYSPITVGGTRVDAWRVYEPNGTLSLSFVTRDGRLLCHDRIEVISEHERRPHYTPWCEYLLTPGNQRAGVLRQLKVAHGQLKRAVNELQKVERTEG